MSETTSEASEACARRPSRRHSARRTEIAQQAFAGIVRKIPPIEPLSEAGVEISDDGEMLALWRNAGAEVKGELVHFPRGLVRRLLETAPASFVQHDEAVMLADEAVGYVSSGGYSHHVGKSVALGCVPAELAKPGAAFEVEINGEHSPVEIVTDHFAIRTALACAAEYTSTKRKSTAHFQEK